MEPSGLSVAVLGGDRRLGEVIARLVGLGARVRMAGVAREERNRDALAAGSADEACAGAAVLVLPVQGVSEDGTVFTEPGVPLIRLTPAALGGMAAGARVFTGIAGPYLRSLCQSSGVPLTEFREADEFAIANSIPSAEGAIQMAMEAAPITIFGSRSLVLGFGRTGRSLAFLLGGLHARVSVAARWEPDLAWARASGHRAVPLAELAEAAADAELIFNTIPAPVLTRAVLSRCQRGTVIVDIATAPGGTDWQAAREHGLKAQLAPGLPGKVAPVTAGRIIADTIVRYLANARPASEERES